MIVEMRQGRGGALGEASMRRMAATTLGVGFGNRRCGAAVAGNSRMAVK